MAPEGLTHRPPPDPWTAAIYVGGTLRGAGVVIGPTRILTAAHVVWGSGRWLEDVWVAFPKAAGVPVRHRQLVRRVLPDGWAAPVDPDVAVLEVDDPVPIQVTPARLRYPLASDLFGNDWWAFGFPGGARYGGDARGVLGANLADGLVRLHTSSTDKLEGGFSGSGLWSAEYQAVVGVVVHAASDADRRGDGHALTIQFAAQEMPDLKLRAAHSWTLEAADEQTHAAWGWTLSTDEERGRHWSPRARGVAVDTDRGYHFRGRTRALIELTQWLDRSVRERRLLVVTGSPGVGKSAVLGRVVTTADAAIRELLPPDDNAVRATPGSVDCAVHVKGKTALEVAKEIARAASVLVPGEPDELIPTLHERLALRPARFNVVVDALDEAASPAQARQLVRLLSGLVRTCAGFGVQVIVGTRRVDDDGDLLELFLGHAAVIDLDHQDYFAEEDLAAYALSTLQLVGAERPNNPYEDTAVADPVAQRIGRLANRNFLVAGLVARGHGLYDTVAVDPATMSFAPTVDASLDSYVARLAPAGATDARLVLTVLAYAEASGLPLSLWQAGVEALGGSVTADQLGAFARTSAANFLIEAGAEPSYRLFHQALNEALLRARASAGITDEDERRLFAAFLDCGLSRGWDHANDYLLRWLPVHAGRAGRVDDLLADDDYVLRADMARLMAAADGAVTSAGQARATLLRRTPQAVGATRLERAAMFSVTQALDRIDTRLRMPAGVPYMAVWANTQPRVERAVLEGHLNAVLGVCQLRLRGRNLLASAGEDGTVRLWDPLTGQTERVLDRHADRVRAVCEVNVGTRTLVASASDDGSIGLWDAETGYLEHRLLGHADWVRAVCAVTIGGQTLLASVSDDCTVRLWDPILGRVERVIGGQVGWVTAVCAFAGARGTCLAWASYGGGITILDPSTTGPNQVLSGHTAWVTGLTSASIDGRTVLASSSYDGTVRIWDPATGTHVATRTAEDRPVTGICTVRHRDRDLLASTNEGGAVHIWDPGHTDAPVDQILEGHSGWATGVCAIGVGDREVVASASEDGTVRLWDPDTGRLDLVLNGDRIGPIAALCAVPTMAADADLVASSADDGSVRLWDAATGERILTMTGHYGPVADVCVVTGDAGELIASAGQDGKVRLRDPHTGEVSRVLQRSGDWVAALCAVPGDGADLLASVGDDQAVRLWNVQTGEVDRELYGHTEWVRGVCVVTTEAGTLLVSASHDGTVRLWDPYSGLSQGILTGHHGAVTSVCEVVVGTRHLLATGSADYAVRLWNPDTGESELILDGHRGEVTALCPLRVGGETLLVSASLDRTVRVWDLLTGALRLTIPVYHQALSCRQIAGRLVIGLSDGMVAIDVRAATDSMPVTSGWNLRG